MLARSIFTVSAILLAIEVIGPAYGQAQSTPSAAQIVKSLTPASNIDKTTRGIRVVNPASAPVEQRPSVSLNVEFATGSAELTPQAMQALDQLAQALGTSALAAYHFRIEGHTDTVGSAGYNKMLSERRAETVVHYLVDKYQIAAARLQPIGMGEQGLLIPTPPQTANIRNRRVLVVNIGS